MTDRRTPIQRLRKANRVDPSDMPSPDSPVARALLDRIVGIRPGTAPLEDRRPVRFARLVVAIILVGGVAATYGISREVRQPLIAVCFPAADLDADPAVVSLSNMPPREACAELWEPGGPFHARGTAFPKLAECVLESGTVGVFPVFPGRDTCAELGLAPPAAPPQAEETVLVQLQGTLSERFLAACVGEKEALAFVRRELERLQLTEWRVVVSSPFGGDRVCASAAFDVADRKIELVPIPAP
jgi:hypothetical protein